MNKSSLLVLCFSILIVSCGGEDVEPGSSSGAMSSSGMSSSGQSNPVASKSGAQIWAQSCANCHGDFLGGPKTTGGSLPGFSANVAVRFDAAGGGLNKKGDKTYHTLQSYLTAEMPRGREGSCGEECATKVANYIRSFVSQSSPVEALACDNSGPHLYGKRELRLLNSREYQNSIEDLLGVGSGFGSKVANNDGQLGGFVNMFGRAVGDQAMSAYMANAEEIAAWAVKSNRPFACADASACASRFINEIAFRAFRRPLTSDESSTYQGFFSQFGASAGMEVALTTLLSAPQFLYHDELGMDIATAMAEGYYDNQGAQTTIEAEDYDAGSPAAPFAVETDAGRTVVNWPGTGGQNTDAGDDTAGQLFYTLVATSANLSFYVTANFANANDDSFHYKLEGKDAGWSLQNQQNTGGYEEVQVASWTGLTVGNTYTLKIQRREDGAKIDALRLNGGEFGATVANGTPAASPLLEADADAMVLSPYQFASALAFRLTGSLPDMQLLQAARKDALTTEAQIKAQVERLIDSDRGRENFGYFAGAWMETDAVKNVSRAMVPEFNDAVKASMAEEVKALFRHVFYDDSVPFSEFYSGDYTFVDKTLADFYGAQGNFNGEYKKATIPGRGGVLTSGAFMAVNAHSDRTSPIQRAVDVRELALCHHIDQPNAALDANRDAAQKKVEAHEAANGGIDSRTFFELYTEDSACAGCHQRIINPLFGMEDFDQVGRVREGAGAGSVLETLANGKKMEVSLAGTLFGVESPNGSEQIDFVGTKDLAKKIASTDAVRNCLVRKGFRFVTGMPASHHDYDLEVQERLSEDQEADFACATSKMKAALKNSNESPREMFKQLGSLELLRFRK